MAVFVVYSNEPDLEGGESGAMLCTNADVCAPLSENEIKLLWPDAEWDTAEKRERELFAAPPFGLSL